MCPVHFRNILDIPFIHDDLSVCPCAHGAGPPTSPTSDQWDLDPMEQFDSDDAVFGTDAVMQMETMIRTSSITKYHRKRRVHLDGNTTTFAIVTALSLFFFVAVVPSAGHSDGGTHYNFLFLLVDDIGYGDFSYMNGTARTPNIDAWAYSQGSVAFRDFHSAGTVCSPTRATVLTGRNHFRDCVDFVYGCPDQRRCPDLKWEFAPPQTFTVAHAIRRHATKTASKSGARHGNYTSFFAGKWHLGAFYHDNGAATTTTTNTPRTTSSPITHGFCHFNATLECARTMTLNCLCKPEWHRLCQYGHYHGPSSSWCPVPRSEEDDASIADDLSELCCSNYWWDDPYSPHGVSNLTWPAPDDDASYLVDTFERFLVSTEKVDGLASYPSSSSSRQPWLAQISFHNCHIPFVGSERIKKQCSTNSSVCRPPDPGQPPYTEEELDYYACLIQLDTAVGKILQLLKDTDQYNNTMIWFTSDNGPEENCPPLGYCGGPSTSRPSEGPGSAGVLRGRKRDIYEGGHRVPAIVSFPALVGSGDEGKPTVSTTVRTESWETVYTTDFLPTVMEILGVDRPDSQRDWAFDGRSIVPLLMHPSTFRWNDTSEGVRSTGIGYHDAKLSEVNGWGYRHGRWKLVHGSASCKGAGECHRPQLFALDNDLGERNDQSMVHPDIMEHLQERFHQWHKSVVKSRREESNCSHVTDIDLHLPDALRREGNADVDSAFS